MILAGGFLLLGACLLVGKLMGDSTAAMAKAAFAFLPLWLVGTGINMWNGVTKAGYSVKEEVPIFLLVFAVPTIVALVVWRKTKGR